MKIFTRVLAFIWILFSNIGISSSSEAVQDAKFKLGETFEAILTTSQDVLNYRVNEQGNLIDIRKITPAARVAFDVHVVSNDAQGITLDWRQRKEIYKKIDGKWRSSPNPSASETLTVKTLLSRDSNHITVTNFQALLKQTITQIENQLAIVPEAQRSTLRKSAMSQIQKLNERNAVNSFAPQALVLSSGFLAKEVSKNRGGKFTFDSTELERPSTVTFNVKKKVTDRETSYKFHREHSAQQSGAAFQRQIPKTLPQKMLEGFERRMQKSFTMRSVQIGNAVFRANRPQLIFMKQRTTLSPLGKEQFQNVTLELHLNYRSQ